MAKLIERKYQVLIFPVHEPPIEMFLADKKKAIEIAIILWREHRKNHIQEIRVVNAKTRHVLIMFPHSNHGYVNPRPRLEVIEATDRMFYVVMAEGRHITRVLAGPFDTRREATDVRTEMYKKIRVGAFGKSAGENPRRIRMGRLVEVRYDRDIGRHKGFYKHTFTTPVDVYANETSIFARPKR